MGVAPQLGASAAPPPLSNILAATFVLAIRDRATSRRFYKEQPGFTEEMSVPGWWFLSRGACTIRLGHCPDTARVSPEQDAAWLAALHVADAQALFDEYVVAGVHIWLEWQDRPGGCQAFAVLTSDGHRNIWPGPRSCVSARVMPSPFLPLAHWGPMVVVRGHRLESIGRTMFCGLPCENSRKSERVLSPLAGGPCIV